jgi:hypothetical protein
MGLQQPAQFGRLSPFAGIRDLVEERKDPLIDGEFSRACGGMRGRIA